MQVLEVLVVLEVERKNQLNTNTVNNVCNQQIKLIQQAKEKLTIEITDHTDLLIKKVYDFEQECLRQHESDQRASHAVDREHQIHNQKAKRLSKKVENR